MVLCSMCGVRAHAYTNRRAGVSDIQGRTINISDNYGVYIYYDSKNRTESNIRVTRHYTSYRVRDVQKEIFKGEVYNFTVEWDNTYIADGISVHNCDFQAAPSGKYYQKYMDDAVKDGRITDVPFQPNCLVNTYWDLGRDGTSIWFIQEVGREVHVIRYHEIIGRGLEYAVEYIKKCETEYGYKWNEHIVPHDADHHELQVETTRVEYLENAGLLNVRCLPKTLSVAEDVHAVRAVLRYCWFDRVNCNPYIEGRHRGIASLKDYSKKFDTKLRVYSDKPIHNWASHGSDGFRQFAVDYQPGFGRPLNEHFANLPTEADHEYDILG